MHANKRQNLKSINLYLLMKDFCFRNLVFEGGGVKGIAYAGALEVLEKKRVLSNIEKVAGTSSGAITATLVALHFTSKEISEILMEADFASFKDDSFLTILDIRRLVKKYGWYKGDAFLKWFRLTLEKKNHSNLTFSQLRDKANNNEAKDLYVIGADIQRRKEVIFSADTFPDMKIADAVRISMSIPLFFKAIRRDGRIYADGGIYYNYPLNLFDDGGYNKSTLGLRVDKTEEIMEHLTDYEIIDEIKSLKDYIESLIGSLIDLANKRHLKKEDWHRTIYIDCKKICSTDFNLSGEQKKNLIEKKAREPSKTSQCVRETA